ncbi:MAG: sigma-70 family RNA polymerase sigma factor [bacterium]|nr:sigma-70 family RNA polymerase sigma factor [bacterium]
MAALRKENPRSEYELFSEYRRTGNRALRDEIVESYIYIAEILSRKFINRGIEYDDIYQVASMGILYAVERFNPERGVKFATFATPTVLGEIRNYFRDKGNFIRIPRRLYEVFYKAEQIKRIHSDVSDDEIARILNISALDMKKLRAIGDFSFIKSLEYEAYADGELAISEVLGAEDNQILMLEDREFLNSCKKRLSDKERVFLELRYTEELSQTEIAEAMGISQMQVSRIEKNVLKKLRDMYFKE